MKPKRGKQAFCCGVPVTLLTVALSVLGKSAVSVDMAERLDRKGRCFI